VNKVNWKLVEAFYKDTFGIDPKFVDIMSYKDILLMCVSGASSKNISEFLGIDTAVVANICLSILNFSGWETDLEFNPYAIFCELKNLAGVTQGKFEMEITAICGKVDKNIIKTSYRLCKVFNKLENDLERNWK